MTILGIETSCDETAASVIRRNYSQDSISVLSSVVASSLSLHAKTGGIIPEIAAREQVKYILPVIDQALSEGLGFSLVKSKSHEMPLLDAIAVTYGPGLIGSLLVGVETAKTLAFLWKKPLIPVNHLYGHIYANFINDGEPDKKIIFPALALVVSGGHTDLVLLKSHAKREVIGGTRDDAAGEAFDKIGRLLGLPYPAGATISKLAQKGDPKAFTLPRPMIGSHDYDFSFSGLKTAVLTLIKKQNWDFTDPVFKENNTGLLSDLCASVETTIVDVLVKKTLRAAKHYQTPSLLLGGGVAANQKLKNTFEQTTKNYLPTTKLYIPEKQYCTDNAAMIAVAGLFAKEKPLEDVTANPELYF